MNIFVKDKSGSIVENRLVLQQEEREKEEEDELFARKGMDFLETLENGDFNENQIIPQAENETNEEDANNSCNLSTDIGKQIFKEENSNDTPVIKKKRKKN